MARSGRLIALVLLAVVLGHIAALQWLGQHWKKPSALKPLATPMLTRLLTPQAPSHPPVVAQAAPTPARVRPPTAAPSTARSTPTLPDPLPVATAPEPTPTSPPIPSAPAVTPPAAVASSPTAPPTLTPTVVASAAGGSATGSSTVSFLDAWPADTRLSYKLTGNFRGPVHGSAQVQWLREDERYEVRIDIDINLLAKMIMTSQGEIAPQGLLPHVYEEERSGRAASVSFTPTEILYPNGTKAPRPPGLQDTASQFVELTQLFASGRARLDVGNSVSFWMARFGGADYWTYDVTEKVMLPIADMGSVEAFHLKPRPLANPRGPITAEMWFAPALQYLPVRIRINMNPTTWVDLMVEKIEQK
jgi:hypothetical protein